MNSLLEKSVSKLYNDAISLNVKTLGLLSTHLNEGVSHFARALYAFSQRQGKKVLFFDCTPSYRFIHQYVDAVKTPDSIDDAINCVVKAQIDGVALDYLSVSVFENIPLGTSDAIQHLLKALLDEFDLIIVDLGCTKTGETKVVSNDLVAEFVQAVVYVILAGDVTIENVTQRVSQLLKNGVNVIGSVLNDRDNPTLAFEMIRETHRFDKILPKLMKKIRAKIRRNNFLNMEV